ncbi:MAG: hypothetical protein M3Y09_16380 [Actinomycetota bacterium]|nr:hypothetical protein [Actinomycetota bacterium]
MTRFVLSIVAELRFARRILVILCQSLVRGAILAIGRLNLWRDRHAGRLFLSRLAGDRYVPAHNRTVCEFPL